MPDRDKENRSGLVSRREFIGGAMAVGLGAALTGMGGEALSAMAPIPENAAASVAEISTPESGVLKILQVTDEHIHYIAKGYLSEPRILQDIAKMVEIHKPDFIVNTGDFWANKADVKSGDTCKWLCKEFAKFKTPWAFAWGNHDESTDYNFTHKLMESAPYLIYRGAAADGNYRIRVTSAQGGAPVWNMILLNDSRGGFQQEQIDWFNQEVARIKEETPSPPPAFLFFHIPLPEYDDIAAPGKAVGVKLENVCHEGAPRIAFPAFRDAGFVRAMFCGHDHVNDYYGEIDGIRLQYGRAVGGYGADRLRKGATLITLDTNARTYETLTVFPDGTSVTFDTFISEQEPGKIY